MEKFIQTKNAVLGALAALGSALLRLLGGWDGTLQALVGFMAADYVTGLVAAGVFHRSGKSATGTLESGAGFKGLVRKCAMLGLVLLASVLDNVVGSGFVRPAVCMFFTANEGISVLENLGLMGVPYPAFLKNMLDVLKKQNDERSEK